MKLKNDYQNITSDFVPYRTPEEWLKQRNLISYLEWVQDLEQVPEGDVAAFIFESLKNKKHLHIFGRYFFPHVIRGQNDVPECHIDLTLEMARRENGAIIFPRGHAKSTWIKLDTIHDIVYELEPVIVYIGNTMNDAMLHFSAIKSELENNELLKGVYGDLVPPMSEVGRKWTDKHFETTNGVNVVARGSTKGRGVNIKHQRPTKIICDDIEDDEQVKSVSRCLKLQHWMRNVILPSLDPERGFVKMIGTVLVKHSEVLKFYNQHGGVFRRSLEDGKAIWPAVWSREKLEAKKIEIGSRSFSQEYQNNPIDEESAIIKPHWVIPHMYTTLKDKEELIITIMMDPQAGEKKGADFYSICALGQYQDDAHRYVLQSKKGRASKLKQAAELIKTFQSFGRKRVRHVGVECVLTQNAVYQNILEWQAGNIDLKKYGVNDDDRNIPIMKITPEGKDKVARLEAHEAAFERGEVHLHTSMGDFGDQIVAFPNIEHDDDVDALVYCLEWSYKSRAFATEENTGITEEGDSVAGFGNVYDEEY